MNDLTGQVFGKLTVLKSTNERKHGSVIWECKCECGNVVRLAARSLIQKGQKSCGCSRSDWIKSDLTGQRYGRLVVLEPTSDRYGNAVVWKCKCDCGNIAYYSVNTLHSGRVVSCGCYNKEKAKFSNYKHGMCYKNVYRRWCGIKARCYNKNNICYPLYGGRGITMCDEWKNDPEAFCNWALENGYKRYLSIDRIDVNGNYEPSNCRWVSKYQQDINRRDTRYIDILDERIPTCVVEHAIGEYPGKSNHVSHAVIEREYVSKTKHILLVDDMTLDEIAEQHAAYFKKR